MYAFGLQGPFKGFLLILLVLYIQSLVCSITAITETILRNNRAGAVILEIFRLLLVWFVFLTFSDSVCRIEMEFPL